MNIDPVTTADFAAKTAKRTFSASEIRDELAREINARKLVYGSLVNRGKLDPREADRRIEIMRHLWEIYREEAKKETPDMFNEGGEGGGE